MTQVFNVGGLLRGRSLRLLALLAVGGLLSWPMLAADAAGTDVLVFSNGDQLTGKVLRALGGTVVFHSDMAGDITVDWAKIKELRSTQKFAVIEKGVKPSRKTPEALVPKGTVTFADQNIQIHTDAGGTTPTIPVKNVDFLIDDPTFQSKIKTEAGILHGWAGAATFGASVVKATQNSYTFNGGIGLVRAIPDVPWLSPRNKTTADFTGSYGETTSPASADVAATQVKTEIYHGDAERDEYLSDRFYYLGAVAFDHNYSQSLDLQQIYGGGFGWTVIKRPKDTLDLKALVQYERQSFLATPPLPKGPSMNLIGSTFSASYVRKLPKNMVFAQQVSYIPAWNQLHAYSFNEIDSLTIPAYKRLNLTVGTLDSYLNDPAATDPPTKRNSFQFTAGFSYSLR